MAKSDNYYLEALSREVFEMVLTQEPVDAKWESMKKAFYDFDIDRVASLRDNNIFQLIKNPDIIRNYNKIKATVENAQEFKRIRSEFGSFENYMARFKNKEKIIKDLSTRIHYLGEPSIERFVNEVRKKNDSLPKT